jgi:nicotinamide mononucleotide (NMN) deamidase PncC
MLFAHHGSDGGILEPMTKKLGDKEGFDSHRVTPFHEAAIHRPTEAKHRGQSMPINLEQLIRNIHHAPQHLILAVAGGGSGAVAELLEVPGASRTVIEALVPYSDGPMRELLGGVPDSACSEATCRAMAMAALLRAKRYLPNDDLVAGVACTASLATDRPKLGPHRAHVAIQTVAATISQSLELQKGRRSRKEEESLVSDFVLNAVAEACGLSDRIEMELLPEERIDETRTAALPAWRDLLLGRIAILRQSGPECDKTPSPQVVFPGAFHPLHAGHRRMADLARQILGVPVAFELSILNVEKPPMDYQEIADRVDQFNANQTVWLTRAATFAEKASLFPKATFLVGTDTLARIADPRFYGESREACLAAVKRIVDEGCRFLAFGRIDDDGRFCGLGDLDLPADLKAVCQEVPAEKFREDISSTQLRLARQSSSD